MVTERSAESGGTMAKALFVVEPDFLEKHVGVRRVIFHYMGELERLGFEIELATPDKGRLWLLQVTPASAAAADGEDAPRPGLARTQRRARPADYETVVVTNPWLCARGLPPLPGCVGIAYDLVPNLIATGCLRFSDSPGIYGFARDHDLGYRYFLEHARTILCISESTRRDLLALYRPARADLDVAVHVPFECAAGPAAEPAPGTVLLVNVLDARKNLDHVAEVLERAHAVAPFRVIVVARERLAPARALAFFQRLDAAGIAYTWFRDVDDDCLADQYRAATVLLFPSWYEGLGLPILEAQQFGVPAISTDVSSCPEANVNPGLCFAPDDVAGMTDALVGVLSGARPHLRGEALRRALAERLSHRPAVASVFGVAGSIAA